MTGRTLIAALALVLPVVGALVFLLTSSGDQTEFLGTRLGMGARQIRSSFEPNGTWETSMDGDLLVLEWSGSDPRVRSARFELHEGLLVAIRAELIDANDAQTVAPDVVRNVRGGMLTMIARGCPVHADEVARLMRD